MLAHLNYTNGAPVSQQVEARAAALGTNVATLIRAQGKAYGMQDISEMPYEQAKIEGGVDIERLANAIIGKESGGNPDAYNADAYGADNPALGMGQILESNIAPWSRQVLGYTVSVRQFRRDPAIQRKIILGVLRDYVSHQIAAGYSPEIAIRRAAAMWYGGPGSVNLYDQQTPQYAGGKEYPSIGAYTSNILERYLQ